MKTRLLTLTLLCAAGLAQADGMPDAAPAAETAPAQTQPQAKAKAPQRTFKPRTHADLRHCLELNSNEAIIRCAEKAGRR